MLLCFLHCASARKRFLILQRVEVTRFPGRVWGAVAARLKAETINDSLPLPGQFYSQLHLLLSGLVYPTAKAR